MDTMQYPIYTETNNCQDCYKCIKVCEVKAIKFENNSASIVPERCVWCGKCVEICPSNAKKVRNDVDNVIRALNNNEKIIVSLAPSYLTEFEGVDNQSLIARFRQAGFFGVSETALGAELVAIKARQWIEEQNNGVYFSSCCPSTIQLINKYYPQYSSNISPILSPVQAHAKYLKSIYTDSKVCFVGPCIAKKTELNLEDNFLDYVLTFKELQEIFDNLTIDFEFQQTTSSDSFLPMKAGMGNLYPTDGGMLSCMINKNDLSLQKNNLDLNNQNIDNIQMLTVSGMENVKSLLEDVEHFECKDKKYFIEILGCSGGCVMGPATVKKSSPLIKRVQILNKVSQNYNQVLISQNKETESRNKEIELRNEEIEKRNKDLYSKLYNTDISTSFLSITPFESKTYTQKDIVQILKRVNKISDSDYLNCGGCGYDNCKSFAKALLDGLAENDMCVSYMRRVARDKTNILLKKMPQGVVIVDENLNIIQANQKFALILGKEMEELYDMVPGLSGMDITKVLPFHQYFSAVLKTCTDLVEQDIRDNENYYRLSVFSVQDHQQVCGILENMHAPEVKKDVVVTRTQDVIKQYMNVVQQIAFLLGENAAYTESMLNSIIESHTTNSNPLSKDETI
ncbi:MAG: 4Fe-4S dicluster domain-containing protein [Bacteroidales bacterium]|nr:4Fe-4S dicluster domain-containing protein [Bacteroidales bacterium]